MRYRKWQKSTKQPLSLNTTNPIAAQHTFPLLFPPGTSWEYGAGLDLVGLLIQRLITRTSTNSSNESSNLPSEALISLESYMRTSIWRPLGIIDATFNLPTRPDMKGRLTPMTFRNGPIDKRTGATLAPDAEVVHSVKGAWPENMAGEHGGAGMYCTAGDYYKLLHSLLANDDKVLRPETVDAMFEPQFAKILQPADRKDGGKGPKRDLMAKLAIRELNNAYGGVIPGAVMDWGLCGMIVNQDVEGKRRKGTMFWGGLPNLFWWIDRDAGVAGMYASQLIPQGDPKSIEMFGAFEAAVYEATRGKRRQHVKARTDSWMEKEKL